MANLLDAFSKDNISKKQLLGVVVGVAIIVGACVSVISYFETKFLYKTLFENYTSAQKEVGIQFRKDYQKQINKYNHTFKQVRIDNYVFMKKIILSIPESERSDRDKITLELINLELQLLNVED